MHSFHAGTLAGPDALPVEIIDRMFRLRFQVFHERLNWEVKVEEGREKDEFDDDQSIYIVGVDDQTASVDAAWRLRPTSVPYMLKDTFPMLLQGRPAPCLPRVWEVSR